MSAWLLVAARGTVVWSSSIRAAFVAVTAFTS
jgi:hypothetical protein